MGPGSSSARGSAGLGIEALGLWGLGREEARGRVAAGLEEQAELTVTLCSERA